MQSGQIKYGTGMTGSACLWLGLFPLMHFGSYRSITQDKWICMLILTGITLVCFLIDALYRRISRPRRLPLLCGAGLLAWILLSCLLSPLSGAPWWIGTGRRDGLASWLCYLCLFFLFSFSKVRRRPVLISAGCSVFVFFAVVMLQRSGGNPFGLYPDSAGYDAAPQYQGTIGNVDMCSGWLVIVCGLFLPFCVENMRNLFRKRSASGDSRAPGPAYPVRPLFRFVFSLLVLSVSVFLLVTMDVASGLLALGILAVWSLIRFLPKKYRLPVLVFLLAAAVLLVWFWPGQGGAVWELHEILHGRPQFSFGSGRIGLWIRSLIMLREEGYLLTGTGPDTFALRFGTFLNRYELAHPDAEFLPGTYDSPHCEYLALLANCGIPALLCFLAMIMAGCLGLPAWRDVVAGYGVQAFLSFSVCIVAPMFWVILGLSLSRAPEGDTAVS